jgi:hypothetical protein
MLEHGNGETEIRVKKPVTYVHRAFQGRNS